MSPAALVFDLGAILGLGALGVLCAWTVRRYSTLSARNFYAPAAASTAALTILLSAHAWAIGMIAAPISAFTVSAALYGRRLRLADLGAGEELRSYEQARRWVWQPAPRAATRRAHLPALSRRAGAQTTVARASPLRADEQRGPRGTAVAAR